MYETIEKDFIDYIDFSRSIKNRSIYRDSSGEFGLQISEYKNRWAEGYKNKFLKKLYRLQDWYNENAIPASFVTFTTRHQKGSFIPIQIDELRNNFLKIKDIMNKMYGKIDYIGNMDFHEDGFAHYHFIFFVQISDSEMEILKKLWSKKYGVGSFEHGIYFETINVSNIDTVAGYVFRHSAKLFDFEFQRPGSLRFNACVRFLYKSEDFRGVRFINCSRHVSEIMKLPVENDGTEYLLMFQTGKDDKIMFKKSFSCCYGKWKNGCTENYLKSVNDYLDYLISC